MDLHKQLMQYHKMTFKALFLVFSSLISFNAYSMSCIEAISTSKNIIENNNFEVASAILEQTLYKHSLDSNETAFDEYLKIDDNSTLNLKSYTLTLPNNEQIVLQLKYVHRKNSGQNYYVLILADPDKVLDLFMQKASFFTSFEDSDEISASLAEAEDPDSITGMGLGFYSIQIYDEDNEDYFEDMPYSVEIVFGDFSDHEEAVLRYQEILTRLFSNIYKTKPLN